ncbi:MAG: hypothetical protein C0433_19145 [Cyclobacterium sp.]|nr:hypothetical protein [Cyclobacterium sp.]
MRIDTFNTFTDFFEDFHTQFTKEFGQEKMNSIAKKVMDSTALNNLIEAALERRRLPTGKDIVETVVGSRAFLFSGNKIILVASMIELLMIINVIENAGWGFEDETMLNVAKQIFLEIRQMN